MVDLLRRRGVAAERIHVFSADGEDPAADLATREVPPADFWILEGTGARQPPAAPGPARGHALGRGHAASRTPGGPARVVRGRSRRLVPGDRLLVFVTDHGTQDAADPENNAISLWREKLTVKELRELLSRLAARRAGRDGDEPVLLGRVRRRDGWRHRRAVRRRLRLLLHDRAADGVRVLSRGPRPRQDGPRVPLHRGAGAQGHRRRGARRGARAGRHARRPAADERRLPGAAGRARGGRARDRGAGARGLAARGGLATRARTGSRRSACSTASAPRSAPSARAAWARSSSGRGSSRR